MKNDDLIKGYDDLIQGYDDLITNCDAAVYSLLAGLVLPLVLAFLGVVFS